MELLGRLTKNTDAEDIFLTQIKKVNDARGLKPGDAGYKTPASYLQKIKNVSLKGKLFDSKLDRVIDQLEADVNDEQIKKAKEKRQEELNKPDDEQEVYFI